MRRIIFILLAAHAAYAQPAADTSRAAMPDTLGADPAQHRVLWMESGSTAPKGRVFIGLHEFLAVRAGFAPFDFLHLDLTYLLPNDQQGVGAKVRIIPAIGFLQGLAVRAEIGRVKQGSVMRPVQTYTGALSLGAETAKLHVDFAAERHGTSDGAVWHQRARLGATLAFPREDPSRMQTLNIEAWLDTTPGASEKLETVGAALRTSKRRFVWEIGIVITPAVSIIGDGPGNRYPLPYLAASWYI